MKSTIITFLLIAALVLGAIQMSHQNIIDTIGSIVVEVTCVDTVYQTTYVPVPMETDVYLVARLIESEAGAEPMEGKIAVGNTVINRVVRSFNEKPKTLAEVIFRKNQFDGINNHLFNKEPSEESKLAAYFCYIENVIPDSTYYFLNPKTASNKKWMKWLENNKKKIIIQNHNFYY